MSRRVLLAAVVLLAAPAGRVAAQPPPAPLDPESSTPILWRVVLDARPHPLLSAAFRDQLRRDLVAALQPALGPLGTVEVVDLAAVPPGQGEPLWREFADKGFAALDAPRDLTGVKTHLLRVEVRDGVYHLESRQHDGFVGLASPVVRTQSTRAPELVGRAAGLMIDRDFGVAGTVAPAPPTATEVTVNFRGGALAPMDKWVGVGDVFAVARVTRAANRAAPPPARTATGKLIAPAPGSTPPPALTPEPVAFTLLKVTDAPAGGAAKCAVLRAAKYEHPLPAGPGVAGYRCLKLGTVKSLLTVRLVSGDGTSARSQAQVSATEAGFAKPPEPTDFLTPRDGLYRSDPSRPVANVACITVTLGKTRTEQFAVPVLGPEPIVLPFEVSPEAEARAVFERAVTSVAARAADARIAQAATFDEVAALIKARKNDDAKKRAEAGFEAAKTADEVLSDEVKQLGGGAEKVPGAAELLARVREQLATLRTVNGRLAEAVRELEAVAAKGAGQPALGREALAQSVNTQINLHLAAGEVEKALAALDQLATLLPDDMTVKARRDKLAAEWKPKSPEHEKARDYLLKTWPALVTVADLRDSLPRLRADLEVCKAAGDRHAMRRLHAILGGFPSKLADLIKLLDPNADADRKALGDAKTVRDVVAKVEQDVVEFLKTE